MDKSYEELCKLNSFIKRYRYLRLEGSVSEETFGSKRYLNQVFYKSNAWKDFRDSIILRDKGCDLGIEGMEIQGPIYIHHINPISLKDIQNRNFDVLLNPSNAICASFKTHQLIHYGSEAYFEDFTERQEGDTCPWGKLNGTI